MIPSFKLFKKIGEIYPNIVPYYSALPLVSITQMEFLIEDFSSKLTKSAVSCRFGHIYWRRPWGKTSFFCPVITGAKIIWHVKQHCFALSFTKRHIYSTSSRCLCAFIFLLRNNKISHIFKFHYVFRLLDPKNLDKKFKLKRMYLMWACRDINEFTWFLDLIVATSKHVSLQV